MDANYRYFGVVLNSQSEGIPQQASKSLLLIVLTTIVESERGERRTELIKNRTIVYP